MRYCRQAYSPHLKQDNKSQWRFCAELSASSLPTLKLRPIISMNVSCGIVGTFLPNTKNTTNQNSMNVSCGIVGKSLLSFLNETKYCCNMFLFCTRAATVADGIEHVQPAHTDTAMGQSLLPTYKQRPLHKSGGRRGGGGSQSVLAQRSLRGIPCERK